MIGQYLFLSCLPAGGVRQLPLLLYKLPLHPILLAQRALFALFVFSFSDHVSKYLLRTERWSLSKIRKQIKNFVVSFG